MSWLITGEAVIALITVLIMIDIRPPEEYPGVWIFGSVIVVCMLTLIVTQVVGP